VIPQVAAIAAAGLAVRFLPVLPGALGNALGGFFYTLLVALLLSAAGVRPAAAALGALVWSCGVEVAQLWHSAWPGVLRTTLPGRLVFGNTFNWLDFPPYAAGAAAYFLSRNATLRPAWRM